MLKGSSPDRAIDEVSVERATQRHGDRVALPCTGHVERSPLAGSNLRECLVRNPVGRETRRLCEPARPIRPQRPRHRAPEPRARPQLERGWRIGQRRNGGQELGKELGRPGSVWVGHVCLIGS